MNRKVLPQLLCALVALLMCARVSAAPLRELLSVSNSEFSAPLEMRRRVDFWIDIFTKYGKDMVVIHHRDYPHIIFEVLDFSAEAGELSGISLERYREKTKKRQITRILETMKYLGAGHEPKTLFEHRVVSEMIAIPGGDKKYRDVINQDLVRSQTGIKEKFRDAVARSGRYLPMMERIFSEHGLPVELTRLPFIESSFDYTAYSSVGAAGIWQFMPRTGKLFSLAITAAVDERRDPIESTIAAASYLRSAYEELGTWPLAITSYNHGPYGVKKAVRKIGTSEIAAIIEHPTTRVFGFASNNFYAEFVAALEVYANYRSYFPDVVIERALEFEQVTLSAPASIGHIRTQLGVSLEDLRLLNYAVSKKAWEGRVSLPRGYALKVPLGVAARAGRLASSPEPAVVAASSVYGGTVYKVRSGDTLGKIAQKFRVSVKDLKDQNDLSADNLRVGQSLTIHSAPQATPRKKTAGLAKPLPASAAGKVTHRVKKGETLWSISKDYGVTVSELKKQNKISGSGIQVGQTLNVKAE